MKFLTVIALCKNERTLCPFFVRHYAPIADKIIVYDNQSTDGSREYLKQFKQIEVREFDTGGLLRDKEMIAIKNTTYYGESSKWFMVVDFDEFIYHPDNKIREYLRWCEDKNILVPGTQGYQMLGDKVPEDTGNNLLTQEIKTGATFHPYSKQAVFHYSVDIRFEPGAHCARPVLLNSLEKPVPPNPRPVLMLLHYKWLSREEGMRRHARAVEQVSLENPIYAKHKELYVDSGEAEYEKSLSEKIQVIP